MIRCVHMLMMQFQRLVVPRPTEPGADLEAVFDPGLDATFYAYALRHSVQVAEMCRVFNPGKIGRAIKAFEDAVPDYKRVRDVLGHFDAYETGAGDLAGVTSALNNSVHFFEYDPANQVMHIGGMTLDVKASYFAANAMLMAVRDVLTPGAFPEPS